MRAKRKVIQRRKVHSVVAIVVGGTVENPGAFGRMKRVARERMRKPLALSNCRGRTLKVQDCKAETVLGWCGVSTGKAKWAEVSCCGVDVSRRRSFLVQNAIRKLPQRS